MAIRSRETDDATTPGGSDAGAARAEPNRSQRAFVIQFDPVESARSRLRGRVEAVASGEAARFRSLKELLAFMLGALRGGGT
jgi:hypothetical protein